MSFGVLWATGLASGQPNVTPTERRISNTVEEQIVPAYRMGNRLDILHLLSDLTKRLDADELETLDDTLAGAGLPKAGEIMVSARLAMVQQNQTGTLPPAHQKDILLIIPVLRDESRAILKDARSHEVMQDPLPAPRQLEVYERLFWEIHVLDNRLRNAQEICEYGAKMVALGGKSRTRRLSESQLDLLDTNFATTAKQLGSVRHELQERRMELRVGRLDQAAVVLDASDEFIERLQAAFVVGLDGDLLARFLEQLDESTKVSRPALLDPELPARIKEQTAKSRKDAGDLIAKSQMFFEGLHWWLRGRYGRGPDGAGLLKSPLALKNSEALFGVLMPKRFPTPSEQSSDVLENAEAGYVANIHGDGSYDRVVPDYERRHHHIWTFEYRRLLTDSSVRTIKGRTSERVITQRTDLSRFY